MENQTIFNIGIILAMIAGFTVITVINPDTGEPLESTHYCESLQIKMYCARTTAQYCYPSLISRKGSKRCVEGWKEIPTQPPITRTNNLAGNRFICDKTGCRNE